MHTEEENIEKRQNIVPHYTIKINNAELKLIHTSKKKT